MKTILLDTGTAALAQAIIEGTPLKVVAYHIGQGANFQPATNANDVLPSTIYAGDATTISPSAVNGNEIRYVVTLMEPVGPFNVGNIMLFLQLGDDPTLIPYLFGVLPVPVPKYQSDPPRTIGNRLVFNLTAKYVNIAQAFELTVTTPQYASLPNYRDEYDLPPASAAVYQQSILQNITVTGAPGVAVRRTMDDVWYVNPFFQRLDDPEYGALIGGNLGDGYLPFYGDYFNGGLYTTPDGTFTDFLTGGTDWAGPAIGDREVFGGTY